MDEPVVSAKPAQMLTTRRVRTGSDDDLDAIRRVSKLIQSSRRLSGGQVFISKNILQIVEQEAHER